MVPRRRLAGADKLNRLVRGSIVLVDLDPTLGHEQRGRRPAVIVSEPEILEAQRFPLTAVVPITSTPGRGVLYPRLEPGPSGLRRVSFALLDQIRSVDKRRIRRHFGAVTADELRAIDDGLRYFLAL